MDILEARYITLQIIWCTPLGHPLLLMHHTRWIVKDIRCCFNFSRVARIVEGWMVFGDTSTRYTYLMYNALSFLLFFFFS